MATKGKAPASRGLDYSLSGDILNRVKGSLDTGGMTKAIDKGISDITTTASTAAETVIEDRLGQVKEEARKKDEANAAYEQGMEAFSSRIPWTSGPTYDKFREIEKTERARYEKAVADGNTELADKILREQQQRAGQQQVYKEVFNGLKDIKLLDLSPEDKKLIGSLTLQDENDFDVVYENGELLMQYKDLNNKIVKVRATDLDKVIARNAVPTEQIKKIGELTQSLLDKKSRNVTFDFNEAKADIKNIIQPKNIHAMMKAELGGLTSSGTFLESITNHPDFNFIKKPLPIGDSQIKADANNDGFLSREEFMELTEDDKNKVVDLMQDPKNFKIASDYLAEFVALSQQRKINKENPIVVGSGGKSFNQMKLEDQERIAKMEKLKKENE